MRAGKKIQRSEKKIEKDLERKRFYLVVFLLERGASLDVSDSFGRTPLMYAAKAGWTAVIELFIEKGANIEAMDKQRNRAMHYACAFGQSATANLLEDRGAITRGREVRNALGYEPAQVSCRPKKLIPMRENIRERKQLEMVLREKEDNEKDDGDDLYKDFRMNPLPPQQNKKPSRPSGGKSGSSAIAQRKRPSQESIKEETADWLQDAAADVDKEMHAEEEQVKMANQRYRAGRKQYKAGRRMTVTQPNANASIADIAKEMNEREEAIREEYHDPKPPPTKTKKPTKPKPPSSKGGPSSSFRRGR
eukprot:g586.t1